MNNSRKKRYARRLDQLRVYKPAGIQRSELQVTQVDLDEFEAIRLCDHEGLSQTVAADEMEVSRATIQRLLTSGRRKIVDSILFNKIIKINNDIHNIKLKGENKLNIEQKEIKRIAFPTDDKVTINIHFGHSKEFVIYTIESNDIVDVKYLPSPHHEKEAFPKFLAEHDADVIITGGMGQTAVKLFNNYNIDVILGAKGRIDVNLNEYLGGFLSSTGSSCDSTDIKRKK